MLCFSTWNICHNSTYVNGLQTTDSGSAKICRGSRPQGSRTGSTTPRPSNGFRNGLKPRCAPHFPTGRGRTGSGKRSSWPAQTARPALYSGSAAKRRFQTEERRELVLIVRMPARQRRAVADDVFGGPQNAPVVDVPCHVVVGADDIEIPGSHPGDEHVGDLLRHPGAGRFGGSARRVIPVNVEPGTSRCAVIRRPSTLRNAWASPSVRPSHPPWICCRRCLPADRLSPALTRY
jgi:hypothetical protein